MSRGCAAGGLSSSKRNHPQLVAQAGFRVQEGARVPFGLGFQTFPPTPTFAGHPPLPPPTAGERCPRREYGCTVIVTRGSCPTLYTTDQDTVGELLPEVCPLSPQVDPPPLWKSLDVIRALFGWVRISHPIRWVPTLVVPGPVGHPPGQVHLPPGVGARQHHRLRRCDDGGGAVRPRHRADHGGGRGAGPPLRQTERPTPPARSHPTVTTVPRTAVLGESPASPC